MPDCGAVVARTRCPQPLRCEVTADEYLIRIQNEMPRGVLWQLDDERIYAKFWKGVAQTLAWTNNALCAVVDELFPCHASTTLARQAEIWGYPVACIGAPASVDELCDWLALVHSPCFGNNLWTLRALLDFFDLPYVDDVVELSGDVLPPGVAGCSSAGCSIAACSDESQALPALRGLVADGCAGRYCRVEILVNNLYTTQRVPLVAGCCAQAGKPLCDSVIPAELQCLIDNYFPSNLAVYVNNGTSIERVTRQD